MRLLCFLFPFFITLSLWAQSEPTFEIYEYEVSYGGGIVVRGSDMRLYRIECYENHWWDGSHILIKLSNLEPRTRNMESWVVWKSTGFDHCRTRIPALLGNLSKRQGEALLAIINNEQQELLSARVVEISEERQEELREQKIHKDIDLLSNGFRRR